MYRLKSRNLDVVSGARASYISVIFRLTGWKIVDQMEF